MLGLILQWELKGKQKYFKCRTESKKKNKSGEMED